jgi:hypothetical protein
LYLRRRIGTSATKFQKPTQKLTISGFNYSGRKRYCRNKSSNCNVSPSPQPKLESDVHPHLAINVLHQPTETHITVVTKTIVVRNTIAVTNITVARVEVVDKTEAEEEVTDSSEATHESITELTF